jgi:DNA topoisomerase-6 subunit B
VPLQYQPKACAISESVYQTNWRGYELQQPKGSLPIAPMALVVHLASVWVPFTSEAKEAVAHYDELLREMKLAIQECGRKLAAHIRARAHADRELKRRSLFEKYIPEVAESIGAILGMEAAKIEKPFYKTLPNFVRCADEEPSGGDGNGGGANGAPPPPAPPDEEPPRPPARAKKVKAAKPAKPAKPTKPVRKGGEQLTLVE